MKTKQVITGEKRMVSLNLDRDLYHKAKVFAATKEMTITEILEDSLRNYLSKSEMKK
jgi:hypothetical protein